MSERGGKKGEKSRASATEKLSRSSKGLPLRRSSTEKEGASFSLLKAAKSSARRKSVESIATVRTVDTARTTGTAGTAGSLTRKTAAAAAAAAKGVDGVRRSVPAAAEKRPAKKTLELHLGAKGTVVNDVTSVKHRRRKRDAEAASM